jgi:hypothetical protein
MYAYWIQIELISLIIALKLVRKYLIAPEKKKEKGLCMQNYGQLLLVLGGTNVPFPVQSS